ncbi:hypothetical protein [Streptomyces sp. HNM0574]|uniref:hypothetical protein n=1 Tax=Streptomyces sp. HNM0574 TaxID=2714954 RepID=UPI001F0F6BB3|nr:hypothetical protein [Streptomyces sp. HNM0574]
MSTTKPARTAETAEQADGAREIDDIDDSTDGLDPLDGDTYDIVRVACPDCRRPIGLLADEDELPVHALCASPWDPFGLTVCQGTGTPASEALPYDDGPDPQDQDVAVLLTLPEGLDWRMQPFSHAGRVPAQRAA